MELNKYYYINIVDKLIDQRRPYKLIEIDKNGFYFEEFGTTIAFPSDESLYHLSKLSLFEMWNLYCFIHRSDFFISESDFEWNLLECSDIYSAVMKNNNFILISLLKGDFFDNENDYIDLIDRLEIVFSRIYMISLEDYLKRLETEVCGTIEENLKEVLFLFFRKNPFFKKY